MAGLSGARDPEAAVSRKQRTKLLDELAATCSTKLQAEIAPALNQRIAAAFGPDGWALEISDDDPQTLLFRYPSVFAESTGGGYVRPAVKIECGAR